MKKFFVLFLVAVAAVSLIACGGSGSASDPKLEELKSAQQSAKDAMAELDTYMTEHEDQIDASMFDLYAVMENAVAECDSLIADLEAGTVTADDEQYDTAIAATKENEKWCVDSLAEMQSVLGDAE